MAELTQDYPELVEEHDRHTMRILHNDLQNLLVGGPIGHGVSRRVYKFVDPVTGRHTDKVIKLEIQQMPYFQNLTEYQIWDAVKGNWRIARWLAPCYEISAGGHWLIQAKVQPIEKNERPRRLPHFLNDVKLEHLGWYKEPLSKLPRRIVCCDYGIAMSSFMRGMSVKLEKMTWRKETS